MTPIKVCGLKPGDDLTFTQHETITHIGVVFVPASKRYVSPNDARVLLSTKSESCTAMGVFVDSSETEITQTLTQAGINGAQLHGRESPELCRRLKSLGLTVWKSVSVPLAVGADEPTINRLLEHTCPYLTVVDGILLDAAPPKGVASAMTGGHGTSFDWSILPIIFERLRTQSTVPVWVAGGLTPENVSRLLETCSPDGIDVSSGVEVAGRKSTVRIHDMIEAVAFSG